MTTQKKILVTGAAGLVGAAVVRRLVDRGDEVVAIDRVACAIPGDIAVRACDLNDIHRLYQMAGGPIDAVIHCGAHSGPMVAQDHPYSMVQVNILGTANMLELARNLGATRFVYCSSTSAYGTTPEGIVPEDTLLRPTSLYGASKVASEVMVTAYADQFGLDGVSCRLSWVYGPRRTTDCFIRGLIEDAMAGLPSRRDFGADFRRHYVHVDDAACALVLATDAPTLPRRTYNVTGGRVTTLGEVASVVQQVLPQADIVLQPGPDPVDDLQFQFDNRAAERDLGYVPAISLEAGIRSYAEWLSQRASL